MGTKHSDNKCHKIWTWTATLALIHLSFFNSVQSQILSELINKAGVHTMMLWMYLKLSALLYSNMNWNPKSANNLSLNSNSPFTLSVSYETRSSSMAAGGCVALRENFWALCCKSLGRDSTAQILVPATSVFSAPSSPEANAAQLSGGFSP